MIKRAQIKFICIIMSILFGFFAVISGISTILLRNANNRNIDHLLDEMVRTLPYSNEDTARPNAFIVKFSMNMETYDIIYNDFSVFSTEHLDVLIKEIDSRTSNVGRVDNVYYRNSTIFGENFLFALDATSYLNEVSTSIVRMYLIFLAIYLILLLIVYLFSFSVFEPIKATLVKQQQFVSNASHELKTPLTIISANADVLKQNQDSQWVDNIKNQAERLEIIISDMLEMAKINESAHKIIKEEFNLSDEIIKAVLPFDALAYEKGKILEFDVIPDVIYKGDKDSIKKILSILLDNAVKYASKDGLIKVSLIKKNGKNILSVYNTGSAVPDDQADKIFERFYRYENSRSRETGGSGLGLAIAKSIAIANKWKISAISKQNEYMIINVIL